MEYQERLEYQPTTSKVETTGELLGETKTEGKVTHLTREEIDPAAEGTLYWNSVLDLMGQQENQHQHILEVLREAVEGREELRSKLLLEWRGNEATLADLEAKVKAEEDELAAWVAMRAGSGTTQAG